MTFQKDVKMSERDWQRNGKYSTE